MSRRAARSHASARAMPFGKEASEREKRSGERSLHGPRPRAGYYMLPAHPDYEVDLSMPAISIDSTWILVRVELSEFVFFEDRDQPRFGYSPEAHKIAHRSPRRRPRSMASPIAGAHPYYSGSARPPTRPSSESEGFVLLGGTHVQRARPQVLPAPHIAEGPCDVPFSRRPM